MPEIWTVWYERGTNTFVQSIDRFAPARLEGGVVGVLKGALVVGLVRAAHKSVGALMSVRLRRPTHAVRLSRRS